PGYVGFEEGGQLTERVRRKPYSVILLDEIEKAHPEVFNILLQVLEDGRLTDGKGRTVDFRNTVIIMTSNVGAENVRKIRLGFVAEQTDNEDYNKMKDHILEKIKSVFRPEFLNRIDELIVFRSLTEDQLGNIFDLLTRQLLERIKEQGFDFSVSDAIRAHIIKEGTDPVYGARPLKRAIQRVIEDTVSEEILKKTIHPGDKIIIDKENEQIVVKKV
ncbi:MAG: AAA family ATPase, partial [Chitinophagales bacterium]